MPYFHVRITQTRNVEFVVQAPNRETAEDIAMEADATDKVDRKKILPLSSNNSSEIASASADKTAWNETLKQQKVK